MNYLISAGHNETSKGAKFEGFNEFDEASVWANKIAGHIGDDALLVPPGKLAQKVEFINEHAKDSIAIEIHFNSAKVWEDLNKDGVVDPGEMHNVGRGALTLHYPNSARGILLAVDMQEAMEPLYGKHWNGVMAGYFRMNPKNKVDYFLSKTHCPSVIIEPEFIHHKELIQKHREVACFNIAQALMEFN